MEEMKLLDDYVKTIKNPLPHIMLCGAGSVGTFLAISLCRVAQRLTIVDPDTLEPHNNATHTLAFALCSNDDHKAYAAKLTVDTLYAPCHVEAVVAKGEELDFKQLDNNRELKYIIIATDTVSSRINIIRNVREQLDALPSLKGVVDTGISHDGWRIAFVKPSEFNNYLKILSEFPERSEDETRACEFVRNISVIAALNAKLLQLLAELEEEEGEEEVEEVSENAQS